MESIQKIDYDNTTLDILFKPVILQNFVNYDELVNQNHDISSEKC